MFLRTAIVPRIPSNKPVINLKRQTIGWQNTEIQGQLLVLSDWSYSVTSHTIRHTPRRAKLRPQSQLISPVADHSLGPISRLSSTPVRLPTGCYSSQVLSASTVYTAHHIHITVLLLSSSLTTVTGHREIPMLVACILRHGFR